MVDTSKYAIVVIPLSEEDGGGYLAKVPDLPGCMGDGDTHEAAIKDVLNAMVEWIDAYQKMGREVPQPGDTLKVSEARRIKENELLSGFIAKLESNEQMIEGIDERLDALKADIQFLMDQDLESSAWERFEVITKERRSSIVTQQAAS